MTLRAGLAKLAGAALAGSLLVFAAPAAAKPCHPHHPGGNSEVAQYVETIPGACGNQPIGGNPTGGEGTSGVGSPSASGLPPATINQLKSLGPAGTEAAGFAEATAPSGAAGAKGGSAGSQSSGTSDDDGSLLSALKQLVTGNDASTSDGGQGLGIWLPILLIAVLLGGFGTLAVRRGRTG
jgi:hypothetical protein